MLYKGSRRLFFLTIDRGFSSNHGIISQGNSTTDEYNGVGLSDWFPARKKLLIGKYLLHFSPFRLFLYNRRARPVFFYFSVIFVCFTPWLDWSLSMFCAFFSLFPLDDRLWRIPVVYEHVPGRRGPGRAHSSSLPVLCQTAHPLQQFHSPRRLTQQFSLFQAKVPVHNR